MAKQDTLIAYNAHQSEMPNPYIYSSHNWMVFEAGRMMQELGQEAPTKACVRGYKVTINVYDESFVFDASSDEMVAI